MCPDGFGDDVQGEVLRFLEANAGFAHVELLSGFRPSFAEPFGVVRRGAAAPGRGPRVAFNTAEGWSRDVTVDIADELRRRYAEFGEVPDAVLEFMDANRR